METLSHEVAQNEKTQVERYLAVLFEPTDLIEVRVLPSGKQFWMVAREVLSRSGEWEFHNKKGRQDIYVGVNPRLREGGREEDVALARSLFADFDDANPEQARDRIQAAKLPEPTLVINSGHGAHAYWKLVEPLTDLKLWRAAQQKLINLLGCDNKIKDPPRIMRLPGFLNIPDEDKGEIEAVPCVITHANAEAAYSVQEVVGDIEPPLLTAPAIAKPRAATNPLDRMQRLSRATLQFCVGPVLEGERNQRLYNAACDMNGNDWSMGEASAKLVPAAESCGLKQPEIENTIRSAYDKPRSPAVPEETDEIGSALERAAAAPGQKPGPGPAPKTAAPPTGARVVIMNVMDAEMEGEPVRYHRSLPQVSADIKEAMSDWPRRAGGMVFTVKEDQNDALPGMECVRWLGKAESLFAWMGHSCDVRWSAGETKHHVRKGTKLNPSTKQELFEYMKQHAELRTYRAVEVLPHSPPVEGLYYLPCHLPPAAEGEGPLDELVQRFNPETPQDRQLMLAALLTPGWGGPAGSRPVFLFTSDHGRGSGKTTTAEVFTSVWGGHVGVGMREEWDRVRSRLLGESSLAKRCVLVDNIKGRLSGSEIEGAITSTEIDGWKPYFGQASRPNLLSWFFTVNVPSLSRDLTERAVVIKVGKQQFGENFREWAFRHVAEHRAAIIAQLLSILEQPELCRIEKANRDRWGSWQDAILSRFPNGNELARMIIDRRGACDSDLEESEEIAMSILRMISDTWLDHETRRIFISSSRLHHQLVKDGIRDRNFSALQTSRWMKDYAASGPLDFLTQHRMEDGRGWLYVGKRAIETTEVDKMPEMAT